MASNSISEGSTLPDVLVASIFMTNEKIMELFQNGSGKSGGGGSVYGTAVPIALTAAAADGPLPIGDIIGGVILAGATAYDATQ